jgi:hypothetical protein
MTSLFSPRRAVLLLALALITLAARAAAAQDAEPPAVAVSDTLVEIRLADGSVLIGRVVSVEGDRVTITTRGGGRVEVERSQIRSMRAMSGTAQAGGEFWPADPNATRLFFGPTARSLKAGQATFGVFELFFPFASYGVTDRISIAGGTPIIPEAIGEVGYIAPKLQVVRSARAMVSVGALAAFGTDDIATAGLVYGVGTFGDPDRAVTVGAALPFYTDGDDGDIGSEPLLMLGGEMRTSRRLKLLTENYFVAGESGALISGGVRILGDRLTADFGVGGVIGQDGGCCLPLVNFVYSFGGN